RKFKTKGTSDVGRASELMMLRRDLEGALVSNPSATPRRLHDREMPWYSDALVPILAARLLFRSIDTTLNLASGDGIVRERRVQFKAGRAVVLEDGLPSGLAGEWITRFEQHERLSLAALADPHPDTIESALEADMITPREKIRVAGQRIVDTYRQ